MRTEIEEIQEADLKRQEEMVNYVINQYDPTFATDFRLKDLISKYANRAVIYTGSTSALSLDASERFQETLKNQKSYYSDMDSLIEDCIPNMVSEDFPEEQAREYLKQMLPKLDYWKRYEQLSDDGQFEAFKKQLIDEINALHIDGMPEVVKLNALVGSYVNLAYPLPNGASVKFLDDSTTYLGNQIESEYGGERCFGILANMDFILVCTYEADGANPELVLFKKR